MTALTVVKTGRPPRLAIDERLTPAPGPGEALLRVEACGFCHHDLLVMSGALRRGVVPGVILGHEIAGAVVAVGDGVTQFRTGERVVSLLTAACGQCARCLAGREHRCVAGAGIGHGRDGGFAEYVALPVSALVAVPDSIPPEEAALLACPAGVALTGTEAAGVESGDTVVVSGAGGGLGAHAVQLAAMAGAQVIAVTTSSEKTAQLETMGASVVIEAEDGLDIAEVVMALTDDAGADAVIDTVGPPLWPATLRCLRTVRAACPAGGRYRGAGHAASGGDNLPRPAHNGGIRRVAGRAGANGEPGGNGQAAAGGIANAAADGRGSG